MKKIREISTGSVAIARLEQGESLIESVEAVLKKTYTRNAVVEFGIGSLSSAEFGVLPPEGPHKRHAVKGPVELVYLGGLVVGQGSSGPYGSHLHIAVAAPDGTLRGGHLFAATVGAAAEVGLLPVHDSRLRRVRDAKRQLDFLEL